MPAIRNVPRIVAFTVELMMNETGLLSGSGSRPKVYPPGEYFIDMFQSSLPAAAGGAESVRLLPSIGRNLGDHRQGSCFALINFLVRQPGLAESASARA